MGKDWTAKEISYLKRYASSKRLEELAQRVEAEEGEVAAKLDALGLQAKDGASRSRLGNEPLLATYEEGLEALYGGKHKQAEKLLSRVAEECDQPELAERARQLLEGLHRGQADGEPESDDPFLLAVFEKNRGNHDRALEIVKAGGRTGKDERFAYLEASIYSLEERLDEAADALSRAIEMNRKNRVHAFHDPDFAPLRKSREHAELFQG
ncbi:MAG: TPR end-of-group domain-containing protein [Thermoanaerobaculia bacterium]